MRRQFETVLSQWGEQIGLPDLRLDANGGCALQIDGIVTFLSYLEETDEVLLSAEIGRVERPTPRGLANILLSANADHRLTDGATLGVRDDGTAVLARQMSLVGLDAAQFERGLERFNDSARVWRANVADCPAPSAASSAPAAQDGWLKI